VGVVGEIPGIQEMICLVLSFSKAGLINACFYHEIPGIGVWVLVREIPGIKERICLV
jgi:hypothetical protein